MRVRAVIAGVLALATAAVAAPPADAAMRSSKLADGTCMTTGGGKIVEIPRFPGEEIDRRLLRDVRWMEKRFAIFVTDGYSMDEVHAANGEHPLGLALDIVPDRAAGGTWADVGRLARWAEPRQDRPRAPFRWVGYKGDENHGPRNHLHISWSHSEAKPGRTARTVYTLRCPNSLTPTEPPPPPGGIEPEPLPDPVEPPETGGVGSGKSPSSGGIAPAVRETDGISAG